MDSGDRAQCETRKGLGRGLAKRQPLFYRLALQRT